MEQSNAEKECYRKEFQQCIYDFYLVSKEKATLQDGMSANESITPKQKTVSDLKDKENAKVIAELAECRSALQETRTQSQRDTTWLESRIKYL